TIVGSTSTLAFNRIIQSYEQQHYYNTTATLLDLVDALNKYLEQQFPNQFIKAVISGFSLNPENYPTRRRRKRWPPICMCCGVNSPGPNCVEPITQSTTPMTTHETSPTTSMHLNEWTNEMHSTGGTDPSSIANSSRPTSSITSSTISYSSQPPTRYSSTSSPTSPTTTSSIVNASQTTTIQPTTSNSDTTSSCNISTFDNGSNRTLVVYLNGTLYFNTTKGNEIDPNKIMDALKSFNPPIVLADKCANKSSNESNFNPALSRIEPPSEVVGDTSFLTDDNTIPTSLIAAANNVTLPPDSWLIFDRTIAVTPSTSASTITVTQSVTASISG
ncbi:unnamed protein product, partial [Adineta steineri]